MCCPFKGRSKAKSSLGLNTWCRIECRAGIKRVKPLPSIQGPCHLSLSLTSGLTSKVAWEEVWLKYWPAGWFCLFHCGSLVAVQLANYRVAASLEILIKEIKTFNWEPSYIWWYTETYTQLWTWHIHTCGSRTHIPTLNIASVLGASYPFLLPCKVKRPMDLLGYKLPWVSKHQTKETGPQM